MRIIFEEHQYPAADVQDVLRDISSLQDFDKKVSVGYVGYFYCAAIRDCVFILPKVLLTDQEVVVDDAGTKQTIEVVAHVREDQRADKSVPPRRDEVVTPEDIITPEGQAKHLTEDYRKFVYEFAVWIYRALTVYRKQNPKSRAIYYRQLPQEGRGRRHKADTYLDIILSLIRFNQENQDFFVFTIRNIHSGHNKINWTKTISRSQAIAQGNDVVYLNPVNKKRMIDYEEELFVIFFSILNHLNEAYGFKAPINCQYELIRGKQFDAYLKGRGKMRLRQIRYKYFSDKLLQLWDMCMAFFDASHRLAINTTQKEYLLAKSFEHVFEAMIDELIGDKDIPKGLKEQRDGKRVDHMYTYYGLTNNNEQKDEIYYIGDSKYYKIGHQLGRESVYKQYTYARNVIQWNIELFMDGERNDWNDEERQDYKFDKEHHGKIRLRDDAQDPLTEGYNVIPNFFISAFVNEDRRYNAGRDSEGNDLNIVGHPQRQTHVSFQFPNRLFDRDTLILSHYDVNFLYVVYLYARNKRNEKAHWREVVRERFRTEIRRVLEERFDFYAMQSRGNPLAGEQFIKENFKDLHGKLFRPYGDSNLYALALEKVKDADTRDSDTYQLLSEFFEIIPVNLGDNPTKELKKKVENYQAEHPYSPIPGDWLPIYHLERYPDEMFLVGMYHDQEHWDWITGKNDRGTLIYNVRLDEERKGAHTKNWYKQQKVRFVILYEKGNVQGTIHVFRVHDTAVMTEQRMHEALYPREPHGDYFIFRFDDEVNIGAIDVASIIAERRLDTKSKYVDGTPIFIKGSELIEYRT